MPCKELFLEQSESYREAIIPKNAQVISLEAGVTTGWQDITGANGLNVGIDTFGASAPAGKLMQKYGLTVEQVVEKVKGWVS